MLLPALSFAPKAHGAHPSTSIQSIQPYFLPGHPTALQDAPVTCSVHLLSSPWALTGTNVLQLAERICPMHVAVGDAVGNTSF